MTTETERAIDLAGKLIEIMKEREKKFGSNENKTGQILMILFPDGLKIEHEEAAAKTKLLIYIIDKLSRYSKEGDTDSLLDLAGYALRLAAFDPKEW
jgi:hypothetical protein